MNHRHRYSLLLAIAILVLVSMPVGADSGGAALFGRDLVLEPGEHVSGDVAVLGGRVDIPASAVVSGDVAVVGGSATVDGTVDGDLVVLGGGLSLGPDALIRGDLVTMGELSRAPGARVEGNTVAGVGGSLAVDNLPGWLGTQPEQYRAPVQRPSAGLVRLVRLLRWIAGLLGLLILAAIVVAVMPESVHHVSELMRHSVLLCIGIGLLTLVAAVFLIPILIVILVGIPVALVVAALLALASLVGWIAAGRLLGQQTLYLLKSQKQTLVLETAVGILLMALLVRVPCLGGLFAFGIMTWGLGAVVLTRFGRSRHLVWSPFAPLAHSGTMDTSRSAPHRDHPFDASGT